MSIFCTGLFLKGSHLMSSHSVDLHYKMLCRCGPQPNSKLLINYGFVDEDNSYDRLAVEVKFYYLNLPYLYKKTITFCLYSILLLLLPGSVEYRGSSVSRQEISCSTKWKVDHTNLPGISHS